LAGSLSHNFVSSIYEDSNGDMWVGTDGGGLNKFNRKTHTFENFTTETGLTSNAILSIKPYDDHTLAISTWEGGLIIFNTNNYTSSALVHEDNNLNSISYKYMKNAVRKGDSLYIFTHGKGMNIYNIKSKTFHNAKNDTALSHFILPETGNKGIFDTEGNLWIATIVGLYRLQNNKMFEYLPDASKPNSINDKYVTDVYIDMQNRLWVGILNGLNLFDTKLTDLYLLKMIKS